MRRRIGALDIRNPTNRIVTPARVVTMKARSLPRRGRERAAQRERDRADRDQHDAPHPHAGDRAVAARPGPQEAPDGPDRAADEQQRGQARADGGEDPRPGAEVLSSLRDLVQRDRALDRCHEDHPDGEAAQADQHRAGDVAGASTPQEVDLAETQPGHVEHGAGQVEDPEAAFPPAVGQPVPEGERGEGEQEEGDRPRRVLRPAPPAPPIERRQGEGQRHERRCRGEGDIDGRGGNECGRDHEHVSVRSHRLREHVHERVALTPA